MKLYASLKILKILNYYFEKNSSTLNLLKNSVSLIYFQLLM
ncbi:hypothetical protein HMPREF9126_0045 [Parvimonas sp. oral taxon 110 str. F0139]|nr:hypothetical protein HMPREF9126_0045 [Parvimonas sp. oral taxon 110 str. F0139]